MTRREHAPYTRQHKLGWLLVAFIGGIAFWALLVLLALKVAP